MWMTLEVVGDAVGECCRWMSLEYVGYCWRIVAGVVGGC